MHPGEDNKVGAGLHPVKSGEVWGKDLDLPSHSLDRHPALLLDVTMDNPYRDELYRSVHSLCLSSGSPIPL